MHYYLIVAIQVFCVYHIYKNRINFNWIWLIIFLPLVGSIVYLFINVFNKRDVDKIQDEITGIINPTKKVKDLERKVHFADTFQNRFNLAEAYLEIKDYNTAKTHFLKAKNDYSQNDYYVFQKLIQCHFYLNDFKEVVKYGTTIANKAEFEGSNEQFLYGLALDKTGNIQKAHEQLVLIDKRYSNYEERLELAKFYLRNNKTNEAQELLQEMQIEMQNLSKQNRRKYKNVASHIDKLLASL